MDGAGELSETRYWPLTGPEVHKRKGREIYIYIYREREREIEIER